MRHDTTRMYSDCQTKTRNETIVTATTTDWSLQESSRWPRINPECLSVFKLCMFTRSKIII